MLLFPTSDFHLEFHRDGGDSFLESLRIKDSADVLVLVGDLSIAPQLESAVRKVCSHFREVVFVAGNHDFWDGTRQSVFALLGSLDQEIPNFHWLENRVLELEDPDGTTDTLRFVGCTLWFGDRPDNILYEKYLGDFLRCPNLRQWVYKQNSTSLDFLSENVREGDIVVTHHLPTFGSVSPAYKSSQLNRFFVCEAAEKIIGDNRPGYWIHGHTHLAQDYQAGDTRVICNPFGYPGQSTRFRETFLLNLP